MERERLTISLKKNLLTAVDKTIDGVNVRNRSHAFETIILSTLNLNSTKNAVILIGGENALKNIPVVEDNLRKLKDNGFEKVYIAVGFLSDKIKQKLGTGKEYGLTLKYLEDGEGSGGSIGLLKKHFKKTFFVLNEIGIENVDIEKEYEYHKNHNGVATVITDNIEELNGLYICEPQIFDSIPEGFSMLETDIFPQLVSKNELVLKPLLQ